MAGTLDQKPMTGRGLFFLAREGKFIGDSASTRLVAIGNIDNILDKIHTFQETSERLLGDTVLGAPLRKCKCPWTWCH